MLYEKFFEEYPDYNAGIFGKFRDIPKNLHEMSSEEINQMTKDWQPVSKTTVSYYKRLLKYYFDYVEAEGIKVDKNVIAEIEIPTSSEEFLIYSSADIHRYFEKLFKAVEIVSIYDTIDHSQDTFYAAYVAGILSFYGMTVEQIAALQLGDVQATGVIGYDLPLTEEDIRVLMRYKGLDRISARHPIKGANYIRTSRDQTIDKYFFSRPIQRVKFAEKDAYLRKLLVVGNLYTLGIFDRVYRTEIEKGEYVALKKSDPQWFLDLFKGVSVNVLTPYKKKYIQYREERNNAAPAEEVETKPIEIKSVEVKSDNADLKLRLDAALKTLKALCAEIEDIQKLIK